MLNEMEEVLELVEAEQIAKVGPLLFSIVAKCVCCAHFQVAERALFLWNNEHLINVSAAVRCAVEHVPRSR